MLDVRRLRLLRDLDRLGTIAAVAKVHTYTPSAVSQQLAVLEREAGVRLLERTGRRVALTPAGAVLVRHAEVVLAALEEADAALISVRSELSGPLRIGAFPTAVRTVLPGALVTLGQDHPGLELMVTELDPVEVPEALRDRRLDVALVNDFDVMPVAPDATVETVPLLDETVYLAVQAGSPVAVQAGGSPAAAVAEVADSAWIAGLPGTACHAVILQVCRAAGFSPVIRHYADDFDAVLALVAAGQGVSLVPELAAARPPDGVALLPLAVRRRVRIAYRQGAGHHPAVAAFVTAVRGSSAEHVARGTRSTG
ncbi:DNA-binding transcriptional LysR family regulator [Kribbella sp. VKM Ac-2527]|uniref:DNA-binding transcriptional LysR family regulator n=1 Tax=Kribbella caucasensis TaxID=2512215 RepID=A0A4R6KA34_9ACTN|nr:LysR family transcriptional regulator [Kribbella sp. VKM Ac-2527]TDO44355.1 DNA-binding transcriptional LysR family regulator [Kribbella sp. VKM Ac-2527]